MRHSALWFLKSQINDFGTGIHRGFGSVSDRCQKKNHRFLFLNKKPMSYDAQLSGTQTERGDVPGMAGEISASAYMIISLYV